ncbi:MAG: GAF domain-containing protein [Deltaproteobacteria bacterium]|nr:GAF domain-containing protein [Deltaproteobacteria bacterium]
MTTPFDITAFDCIFRDISPAIHVRTHAKDIAILVIKRVVELLKAKGAMILTLNTGSNQADIAVSYGLSEEFLNKGPVSWETIIRGLQGVGDVIFVKDVMTDPRVQYPEETWKEGIRMIVDVPLTLGNRTVGIMRVYFPDQRELSKEEIHFLIFTSHQGACAIEKAGLIETQQEQYDQLALQTEKLSALGRMGAGIAHEINNPLAGILLYSSNMIKKVPDKGPLREGLEVIINETKRCKTIIQDLLEFSRESKPKTALANINDIVEKALSLLANEFSLHHIRVEKRLAKKMMDVMLDEKQIEQVLVNLLLNALHALGEEGVITVKSEVDLDKGWIGVEIADTGCGIPEEHVSRVFEPFFSTKSNGTGLGLSVSYGIVQKHNGSILVSSLVGEGTRFTLEFPFPSESVSK